MMIAFLATARSPMAIPDTLCFSGVPQWKISDMFMYHVDVSSVKCST